MVLRLFLMFGGVPDSQSLGHHEIWHQLDAWNLACFLWVLVVNLLSKLVTECHQIIVFLSSIRVVIDSKENTVRIVLRIEAKKQLAKFKSRSTASLSPEDIDILYQAITKHLIEMVSSRSWEQLNLRYEILSSFLVESILDTSRRYRMKIAWKSIFECK